MKRPVILALRLTLLVIGLAAWLACVAVAVTSTSDLPRLATVILWTAVIDGVAALLQWLLARYDHRRNS